MNDAIKQRSSGYANFNYSERGYQPADLVKVDISVNGNRFLLRNRSLFSLYLLVIWIGEHCEPLSFVCHIDKTVSLGRKLTEKLKEVLDRQQFEIIIQAKIGSKVFFR